MIEKMEAAPWRMAVSAASGVINHVATTATLAGRAGVEPVVPRFHVGSPRLPICRRTNQPAATLINLIYFLLPFSNTLV